MNPPKFYFIRGNSAEEADNASPQFVLQPEYCDLQGLYALFGIRRTQAYQLLKDGYIKGMCLKKRGAARGRRLFHVQSVREFLQRHTEVEY